MTNIGDNCRELARMISSGSGELSGAQRDQLSDLLMGVANLLELIPAFTSATGEIVVTASQEIEIATRGIYPDSANSPPATNRAGNFGCLIEVGTLDALRCAGGTAGMR